MAAERETTDRLIAAYLADRVGAEFDARISGVTRSGLFVRLRETGADGFVPAATIGNDYYRHHEDSHALIGERTGETLPARRRACEVRLVEAIPTAGALRFEMLSRGQARRAEPQAACRRAAASRQGPGGRGRVDGGTRADDAASRARDRAARAATPEPADGWTHPASRRRPV